MILHLCSLFLSERMASTVSILQGHVRDLPPFPTIHGFFDYIVRSKRAGKPVAGLDAIRSEGKITAYGELSDKVNLLASGIVHQMVNHNDQGGQSGQDKVIAILIPPSEMRIVSLLAIFKTGAAYLPLDPVQPIQRMKHILQEAKPMCILAAREYIDMLNIYGTFGSEFIILDCEQTLEEAKSSRTIQETEIRFEGEVSDNPLACVLYTSGSTGVPKGVRLNHRNVINRLHWQWQQFPFQDDEVGCGKTSILFVDSLTEALSFLLQGLPLVIVPKAIAQNPESLIQTLEENKVTRLLLVPSLLRSILLYLQLQPGLRLGNIRLFISSGEALPPSLLMEFFEKFPDGHTLANFYGSTETTGDVTFDIFHDSTEAEQKTFDHKLSIGKPIYNCNVYILDEDLKPMPKGESGEIYLSGLNIVDGYVDKQRMTRFKENTVLPMSGHETMFRTGDYGRIVDGRIIYEGRQDSQIKIRGQRVDVSEIERVIQGVPGVDRAVVINYQPTETTQILVAFYTSPPEAEVKEETVLMKCRDFLPVYMVPEVTKLTEFPYQAHTGKIDRAELKSLCKTAHHSCSAAGTDDFKHFDVVTDRVLSTVSMELGVPKSSLRLEDSFFEIGGNSVNAISTMVKLRKQGLDIDVSDFLNAASLQAVTDVIRTKVPLLPYSPTTRSRYSIVPLNNCPDKERSVTLLSESFCAKEAMVTALKVPVQIFSDYLMSIWPAIVQDNLSIVVRDNDSNKMVAAGFIINFDSEPDQVIDPLLSPIDALVHEAEDAGKNKLRGTGKFLLSTHSGTDLSMSPQENVKLIHMMDEETIRRCKSLNYDGIMAVNSHHVTAVSGLFILRSKYLYIHFRNINFIGRNPAQ